ncbi:MAG: carboxypeptidase-like regulatory domain-containing protein [Bacteroidota bacterium]
MERYKRVKEVILILCPLIFVSLGSLMVDQRGLSHRFKGGDCIIFYDFVLQNDSIFMIGDVLDKKSKDPLQGLNIIVQQTNIGTVTEPAGDFKIFLQRQKGELRVFFGPLDFNMPYSYDLEDLMKKNTTHH